MAMTYIDFSFSGFYPAALQSTLGRDLLTDSDTSCAQVDACAEYGRSMMQVIYIII